MGVGINLKTDGLSPTLRDRATTVEALTGCKPDGELLLEKLVRAIGERYELLQSLDGCEHTIREWCANSSYAMGRQVRISLDQETFEGTTRGLESDGALRVETTAGEIRIVRAGDVTAVRAFSPA